MIHTISNSWRGHSTIVLQRSASHPTYPASFPQSNSWCVRKFKSKLFGHAASTTEGAAILHGVCSNGSSSKQLTSDIKPKLLNLVEVQFRNVVQKMSEISVILVVCFSCQNLYVGSKVTVQVVNKQLLSTIIQYCQAVKNWFKEALAIQCYVTPTIAISR